MDDFEDIMRRRLKNFKKCEGCVSGYVEEESYDSLLNELRVFGYDYSVRTSRRHKTSVINSLSYSSVGTPNSAEINFCGCPFKRMKTAMLECSLGPHYYKKHRQIEEVDQPPVKKRTRINSTKKTECPAWLTVQSVKVFTEFIADSPSRKSKRIVSDKLRKALRSPSPPSGQIRCYIKGNIEHNHTKSMVYSNQTIHPELVKEIRRLVRSGITSALQIRTHLRDYSAKVFRGNRPTVINRTFYPPQSVIYTHVYKAIFALNNAKADQEALLLEKQVSGDSPSCSPFAGQGEVFLLKSENGVAEDDSSFCSLSTNQGNLPLSESKSKKDVVKVDNPYADE